MVIIFPLREKLKNGIFALQQKPRWTGGRPIPEWPSLPWNDEDRPPQINFGTVDRPPIAAYALPSNYGLCALGLVSVEKKKQVLPPQGSLWKIPSVVHELKIMPPTTYKISGITKDSTGAVLGNCTVQLFYTANDKIADEVTSNASGVYEFRSAAPAVNFYVVAYKAGSPDVAGTTVNTLIGV